MAVYEGKWRVKNAFIMILLLHVIVDKSKAECCNEVMNHSSVASWSGAEIGYAEYLGKETF